MKRKQPQSRYVLCVDNRKYPASLELRKIYAVISDPKAAQHSLVRVVDESGEDYLYPERNFVRIEVPKEAAKVFAVAG